MRAAGFSLAIASLVTGCIDDLPLPQVVEDTRVLSARMQVDGAPERAWPRLDESGVVSFAVVGPNGAASVGWGFVVCPATVTPTGLRICTGDPLDIAFQMEPSTELPSFPVSFPAAVLRDVEDVLIQGVLCPDGSPSVDLDNADVACSGTEEPRQLVSYTVHIERDDLGNRNPTIPTDAFTFAGAPWNEATAVPPETGCAAMAGTAELPLATRSMAAEMGTDSMGNDAVQERITITGNLEDREEFPFGETTRVEDLVFAHYATFGEPTRQFSVVDEEQTVAELKWAYPPTEEIASDGTLARFFITLIDQRGGSDWVTRYVCVVP